VLRGACAGDERARGRADAGLTCCGFECLANFGMPSQRQVVVRAEMDQRATFSTDRPRGFREGKGQLSPQTCGLPLAQFLVQIVPKVGMCGFWYGQGDCGNRLPGNRV